MWRPRLNGTNHDRWLWAGVGTAAALAAGGLVETAHIRRLSRDPERKLLDSPPEGRARTARSADGTALHVEVFGPEDGPTVVLAHGWTETLQYWVYVIRALSKRGFRVVAYDQRGHGSSEPAHGGDYVIDRFGEDLEAVLSSCVPDGQLAVIAGHSLGAMSIAAWAEHHDVERRARAAALLSTGVGDLIAEHLLLPLPSIANAVNRAVSLYGFLGNRAPLPRYSTPLSYAAVRYIAFGRHASPAQVAFFERMLVTCPPDVRAKIGIAMSEMDLHDAVPRLTIPTTVLVGADDRLTPPSHARRIAANLPHLEKLIVLPETGHMTPLERPEEVTAALVELAAVTAERVVV
ncbi:MAG TPA: alpha/beta hydrolase [Solirubrobacteraceae bacterium]|jgi:pimeloyl-ACP methyl ester carboxylesterase|nr:alpha/beta hydrolase [Solirubrobacteraceae bacterium]